eukprot:403352934
MTQLFDKKPILENSIQSLSQKIHFKRKIKRQTFQCDDETKKVIEDDCEKILVEAQKIKKVEDFKEKLSELLEKSQIQQTLDTEMYKLGKEEESLNIQKMKTQNAQAKVRQFYTRNFENRSLENIKRKQGEPTLAQMVENGNEGYLNLLIEYVMNKKGFVNKKERYIDYLIDLCLNKNKKHFKENESQIDKSPDQINKDSSLINMDSKDLFSTQSHTKLNKSRSESIDFNNSIFNTNQKLSQSSSSKLNARGQSLFDKFQESNLTSKYNNLQSILQQRQLNKPEKQEYLLMQELLNKLSQLEKDASQERLMVKQGVQDTSLDETVKITDQKNVRIAPNFFDLISKNKKNWDILIKDKEFEKLIYRMSLFYGYQPEIINDDNLYENSKRYGNLMLKKKQQSNALHNLDQGNVNIDYNKHSPKKQENFFQRMDVDKKDRIERQIQQQKVQFDLTSSLNTKRSRMLYYRQQKQQEKDEGVDIQLTYI